MSSVLAKGSPHGDGGGVQGDPWTGRATHAGTLAYSTGSQQGFIAAASHFRQHTVRTSAAGDSEILSLSSIGIGTYLGDPSREVDELVENAVVRSVSEGCNVVDTASIYREGRAEACIGRALRALRMTGGARRDQLFISTKAGFEPHPDVLENMKESGVIGVDDVACSSEEDVANVHMCMHPAYLELSLNRSLKEMQLESIDLFYLHNPAESWLGVLGSQEEFLRRLGAAFEFCEAARADGRIATYGIATWDCFHEPPSNTALFLSLQEVVRVAERVGGPNHGFQFIQLPINGRKLAAWEQKWQTVDVGGEQRAMSAVEAAAHLGIGIFSSGPLGETSLLHDGELMTHVASAPELARVHGNGARLLQLARSTPGLLAALIGHKTPVFVEENLALVGIEPLSAEEFARIMARLKEPAA